jgi:orotidine-5'-phosphate decarboxylase
MAVTIPIVALDVPTVAAAMRMVEQLGDSCRFYKIGSELFTAAGPQAVECVRGSGARVFLDLKLHDIPNTVRGAAHSASVLGASLLTVHATGGVEMMRAAVEGADAAGSPARAEACRILAVTVLTSLDAAALAGASGRASVDPAAEVLRLSDMAAEAGVHGVVCSGREAAQVRERHGDGLTRLVPGIRLSGGNQHDQARVVTPAEAARSGATYVVVGRAVTKAADPAQAMERVLAELAGA